MRVQFIKRDGGPEKLVCEAEIVFGKGEFLGMKLVGFALWRGSDEAVYVTFPARAFGYDAERRYFDLLRSVEGDGATVRRVKEWILAEYRKTTSAAA